MAFGQGAKERYVRFLKKPDMSVGQIARKVGYHRLNAFIRIFKNLEGVTPGAYRESRKA